MAKPVILVSISNPEDMRIPPLALLYVGGALKKAGYDVDVRHISSKEIESSAKKIAAEDALFIGLSVITGCQTKHSAEFSKLIKNLCNAPVIWGGVHPSLLPEQCLSESYIDYVCIGEGEVTAVEFARMLEGKKKIETILGLAYKKDGRIFVNAPRPLNENLDIFWPDFGLVDITKYFDSIWGHKKILTIITSRGCIFNCAFCYNLKYNQRRWRAHSVDKIVNFVNLIKEIYKIDGVRFFDDFFFANPERAIDTVRRINLSWYGELRVRMINPKLIKQLEETKCREVLFGFESGVDRLLRFINKQQTVEDIRQDVRMLASADIRVTGSFILGLPTETQQETFQTIDLILELYQINKNLRYTLGFYLPYPGSDLYELACRMGFRQPERTEDWGNLDRWSNKMKLSWLDWTQDSNYFMTIRDYVNLLPLSGLNMPLLSSLPERRLRQKDFSRKLEHKLLSCVQKKYAPSNTRIHKIVRSVLAAVRS